jgi:hypothetical protein
MWSLELGGVVRAPRAPEAVSSETELRATELGGDLGVVDEIAALVNVRDRDAALDQHLC